MTSAGSASRSTVPNAVPGEPSKTEYDATGGAPGRPWPRQMAALGCTGPPPKTTPGSAARGCQASSTSPTAVPVGRFSTRPSAPSSSSDCSSSTTVRAKFGSSSCGVATRSRPVQSAIGLVGGLRTPALGAQARVELDLADADRRRRHLDALVLAAELQRLLEAELLVRDERHED